MGSGRLRRVARGRGAQAQARARARATGAGAGAGAGARAGARARGRERELRRGRRPPLADDAHGDLHRRRSQLGHVGPALGDGAVGGRRPLLAQREEQVEPGGLTRRRARRQLARALHRPGHGVGVVVGEDARGLEQHLGVEPPLLEQVRGAARLSTRWPPAGAPSSRAPSAPSPSPRRPCGGRRGPIRECRSSNDGSHDRERGAKKVTTRPRTARRDAPRRSGARCRRGPPRAAARACAGASSFASSTQADPPGRGQGHRRVEPRRRGRASPARRPRPRRGDQRPPPRGSARSPRRHGPPRR